ncbi:methylcrotonoyl-CoA carboxylase, partial [Novosphingobium sp. AAP83]|uniref:ATP-binding protein n=1 Tax=Novosphingobium sp. AAP83 TaxID=1523425 RepID=UPI0006CC27B4
EAVCGAAVRAAQAVDYEGAGTIEFIADGSEGLRADRIWFMEMNTRLQVEHPVTEEITGVDLVEWQLRVASGEPLPKRQDELSINGWAMEARLYAEDATKGFLPSIGRVSEFHFPQDNARIDTGVEPGAEISTFYDPMIAKVIVHRETRDEAIAGLRDTLAQGIVGPLISNSGFLWRLLGQDAFGAGVVDTGLIERNLEVLATRPEPSAEGLGRAALRLAGTPGDAPWSRQSGLRLNAAPRRAVLLADQFGRQFAAVLGDEPAVDQSPALRETTINEGGEQFVLRFARTDGGGAGAASDGAILSPMPGKVISVDVTAGQAVTKGQKLLVLEAMKMEHALTAPFDGTVAELNAVAGAQVQVEALLVKIAKAG